MTGPALEVGQWGYHFWQWVNDWHLVSIVDSWRGHSRLSVLSCSSVLFLGFHLGYRETFNMTNRGQNWAQYRQNFSFRCGVRSQFSSNWKGQPETVLLLPKLQKMAVIVTWIFSVSIKSHSWDKGYIHIVYRHLLFPIHACTMESPVHGHIHIYHSNISILGFTPGVNIETRSIWTHHPSPKLSCVCYKPGTLCNINRLFCQEFQFL